MLYPDLISEVMGWLVKKKGSVSPGLDRETSSLAANKRLTETL